MLIISFFILLLLIILLITKNKERFDDFHKLLVHPIYKYIGCQDTTVTGKTCKFWNDESVDETYNYLGGHNYCRYGSLPHFKKDEKDKPMLWCFTENEDDDEDNDFEQCCPIGYTYSEDNGCVEPEKETQPTSPSVILNNANKNDENDENIKDNLNFFIRPVKDKNGNILESDKYYHGHLHIHDEIDD